MANTVTVKELVDSSGYIVLSGEEFLGNKITTSEISRPGVELTGFFNFYPSARIQLLGKTELTFIERMTAEERLIVMRRLMQQRDALLRHRTQAAGACRIDESRAGSRHTDPFGTIQNDKSIQ